MKIEQKDSVRSVTNSMIVANTDIHEQLHAVIESLKDENLAFKLDHYDRTIAAVVSHSLMTLRHLFLGNIVLGNSADSYQEPKIDTINEALAMIQTNQNETNVMLKSLNMETMDEVITTEWGQEMTKELAVWQGIMQMAMHLGEITLMAGIGGFYKGTLG